MATRLPSLGRKTARGADRARWPHARGVVPALLAMGLAALVSASAARNETLTATAPAAAPTPSANPAADPSGHPGIAAEPDIEAVAGTVARRYRISQEATRELVGEAYGEGRRIGLDPLLIIAVMAVESRFNPIAQSDGGAIGLMQVIPRYHADQLEIGRSASVLDPRTNIGLGARVLKEYIRRGGTEAAGLQLYNGAAGDASNGYANKVLGERQRLQQALRRARERSRA
jgi:soluble lytic murein transglycosylase-like protein